MSERQNFAFSPPKSEKARHRVMRYADYLWVARGMHTELPEVESTDVLGNRNLAFNILEAGLSEYKAVRRVAGVDGKQVIIRRKHWAVPLTINFVNYSSSNLENWTNLGFVPTMVVSGGRTVGYNSPGSPRPFSQSWHSELLGQEIISGWTFPFGSISVALESTLDGESILDYLKGDEVLDLFFDVKLAGDRGVGEEAEGEIQFPGEVDDDDDFKWHASRVQHAVTPPGVAFRNLRSRFFFRDKKHFPIIPCEVHWHAHQDNTGPADLYVELTGESFYRPIRSVIDDIYFNYEHAPWMPFATAPGGPGPPFSGRSYAYSTVYYEGLPKDVPGNWEEDSNPPREGDPNDRLITYCPSNLQWSHAELKTVWGHQLHAGGTYRRTVEIDRNVSYRAISGRSMLQQVDAPLENTVVHLDTWDRQWFYPFGNTYPHYTPIGGEIEPAGDQPPPVLDIGEDEINFHPPEYQKYFKHVYSYRSLGSNTANIYYWTKKSKEITRVDYAPRTPPSRMDVLSTALHLYGIAERTHKKTFADHCIDDEFMVHPNSYPYFDDHDGPPVVKIFYARHFNDPYFGQMLGGLEDANKVRPSHLVVIINPQNYEPPQNDERIIYRFRAYDSEGNSITHPSHLEDGEQGTVVAEGNYVGSHSMPKLTYDQMTTKDYSLCKAIRNDDNPFGKRVTVPVVDKSLVRERYDSLKLFAEESPYVTVLEEGNDIEATIADIVNRNRLGLIVDSSA